MSNVPNSALASLTATYTDSEGEDEEHDENNVDQSPSGSNSDNKSTNSSRPGSPASNPSIYNARAKLVSYHDDTIASDDDAGLEEDAPQDMLVNTNEVSQESIHAVEDDILIPPEPTGSCSAELQEKIAKLYEKMQTQQMDMNAVIQKRKDFRNPSIYEKLIQFCGLNELGTNYPPSIYDPVKWTKESYYEELAKVQKTEMDKREKDRKSKVELIAGAKKADEDSKKRKSKWDMPGGGAVKMNQPGLLAPPTLTTSATGTKNESENWN